MILNEISQYISVDDIVTDDSENYAHFLTHIDKSFVVPTDWKSIIYTSSHIFKFLWRKKHSINQKFFRILPKDESYTIKLKNGFEFKVTMFEISKYTGNLAFYFKGPKTVLYTGPYTIFRDLLLNIRCQECVINKIGTLYLDNTRANSPVESSVRVVSNTLRYILKEHPGYKILMHLPAYGYEELIYGLLIEYNFRIYAGKVILEIFKKHNLSSSFETNVKNAEIILGEKCYTVDEIEQFYGKKKRLTVRIIESNNQLINLSMKSIGLYQINWSPHPSLFNLHNLISFVRPKHIRRTQLNMPDFPQILHELCECDCKNNVDYIKIQTEQQQLFQHKNNHELTRINLNCRRKTNGSNILLDLISMQDNEVESLKEVNEIPKEDQEYEVELNNCNDTIDQDNDEVLEQSHSQHQHQQRSDVEELNLNRENDKNDDEIITIASSPSDYINNHRRIHLPLIKKKRRKVAIVHPMNDQSTLNELKIKNSTIHNANHLSEVQPQTEELDEESFDEISITAIHNGDRSVISITNDSNFEMLVETPETQKSTTRKNQNESRISSLQNDGNEDSSDEDEEIINPKDIFNETNESLSFSDSSDFEMLVETPENQRSTIRKNQNESRISSLQNDGNEDSSDEDEEIINPEDIFNETNESLSFSDSSDLETPFDALERSRTQKLTTETNRKEPTDSLVEKVKKMPVKTPKSHKQKFIEVERFSVRNKTNKHKSLIKKDRCYIGKTQVNIASDKIRVRFGMKNKITYTED